MLSHRSPTTGLKSPLALAMRNFMPGLSSIASAAAFIAADRLNVDVYAQQFNWTYGYPEAGIETGTLVIPEGRQVQLNVRARDVIHDFWVPEFGIRAMPFPALPTPSGSTPRRRAPTRWCVPSSAAWATA